MRTAALLLPLLLTGCASLDYASDAYRDSEPVEYQHGGKTFTIIDNPVDSKLLIADTGGSMGTAVMQGLTFGAYPGPSQAIFRPVIREFLAEHRTCEITGGWLLVDPWWEFEYQCWISQQTAPGQWLTAPGPSESAPLEPTAGP